eukprot:tig00021135_g18930.t1
MPALLASSAEDDARRPRIVTLADGFSTLNSVPQEEQVALLLLISSARFPLFESIITEILTGGTLEQAHGRSPQGSLAVCDVDMGPKPLADIMKTPKLAAAGAAHAAPLRVGLLRYRLSHFADARGAEALAESAALVPALLAATSVVLCVGEADVAGGDESGLAPLAALEAAAARLAAGRASARRRRRRRWGGRRWRRGVDEGVEGGRHLRALPFGRKKSGAGAQELGELPHAAPAPPPPCPRPSTTGPRSAPSTSSSAAQRRGPPPTSSHPTSPAPQADAEASILAALRRRSSPLLAAFASVRGYGVHGEGPERDQGIDRVLRVLLDERSLAASGRAASAAFLADLIAAAADRVSGAGPGEAVRAWEAAGEAWERHGERVLEGPRGRLRLAEGGAPLTKEALAVELQYREEAAQAALRAAFASFSPGMAPPPHVAHKIEARLREEAVAFRVAATRANAARVGSGTNAAAARLLEEARGALRARAGPDGFTGLLKLQTDKESLKAAAQQLLQGAFERLKGALPATARKTLESCLGKELQAEMEAEIKVEVRRATGAALAALERAAACAANAEAAMARGHDRLVAQMPMLPGQVRYGWAVETSGASESAPPHVRPNTARQMERLNLPPVEPGQANGVQAGLAELARLYRECFHLDLVRLRAKERIQRVEGLARAAGRRLQASQTPPRHPARLPPPRLIPSLPQATNMEVARGGFADGVQRAEAAVRPLGEEAGARVLEDAVAQLRATYEPLLGADTIEMGSKALRQRVRAAWKARASATDSSMREALARVADEPPTPPNPVAKEEEITKAAGVVGVQLQFPASPAASPSKAYAATSPASTSSLHVLAARSPSDADPASPGPPLFEASSPPAVHAPAPGRVPPSEGTPGGDVEPFNELDEDF